MKIGLIDVDGHHFPNLALMRISAWHKAQGDQVEWWQGDLFYYDRIYASKVFSFSPEIYEPVNCGEFLKGGTGYAIGIDKNGKEVFDESKNTKLPDEIERMFPDYSIYPQYSFAVSMTSRGCPRGCNFCHVAKKEGRRSCKVADVADFWSGQKEIVVLDPNITACNKKRDLMEQYIGTGAYINFSQGLDIRLLDDRDIDALNKMKIKGLHFAWDKAEENLEPYFKKYTECARRKDQHGAWASVYVLTNFNSTLEQDLYRIYTLRDMGYDPFVMVYDKEHASATVKRVQRWVNAKWIFKKVKRFEDYI